MKFLNSKAMTLAGIILLGGGAGLLRATEGDPRSLSTSLDNPVQYITTTIVATLDSNGGWTENEVTLTATGDTISVDGSIVINSGGNRITVNNDRGFNSILGGSDNVISGAIMQESTIAGGIGNEILSSMSFIGGGKENLIRPSAGPNQSRSTILGGTENIIGLGEDNVILGGEKNNITGSFSTIMGSHNSINGNGSFAAGSGIIINANGTFARNDGSKKFEISGNNIFAVQATNGVVVGKDRPHPNAALTLSRAIRIQPSNKDNPITDVCNSSYAGIIQSVNNPNAIGTICLCACNGSEWQSLGSSLSCKSTCGGGSGNITPPVCGVSRDTCTQGTLLSTSHEDKINGADNITIWHWTCINGTITKKCEESFSCKGPDPDPNAQPCGPESLSKIDVNKQKVVLNVCNYNNKCEYTCKQGFEFDKGGCKPTPQPVNGVCNESVNNKVMSTAPSGSALCSAGTPTSVIDNNQPQIGVWSWLWTCNGLNGGGNSGICTTHKAPECGSAHEKAATTIPSTNLCVIGLANFQQDEVGTYNWICSNGGTNKSCRAYKQQTKSCTGLPSNAVWSSNSSTTKNITQTWDGSSWDQSITGSHNTSTTLNACYFKCNANYTWNSSTSTCVANTQPSNCTGLPSNAVWSSNSSTTKSITQTWNGSSWTPVTAGSYNTSTTLNACYFKCNTNYTRNSSTSTCVANTQPSNCAGLPSNAVWSSNSSTTKSITQTWNGSSWTPVTAGSYNTSTTSNECYFKCNTNYTRNSSTSTCVTSAVNGKCGTASGQNLVSAPSGSVLCSSGTASSVTTTSTEFTWTCNGSNGGSNVNCKANKRIDGSCGTATCTTVGGGPTPTSSLCAAGTASSTVNGDGKWTWTCNGSNGGSSPTCTANKKCRAKSDCGSLNCIGFSTSYSCEVKCQEGCNNSVCGGTKITNPIDSGITNPVGGITFNWKNVLGLSVYAAEVGANCNNSTPPGANCSFYHSNSSGCISAGCQRVPKEVLGTCG